MLAPEGVGDDDDDDDDDVNMSPRGGGTAEEEEEPRRLTTAGAGWKVELPSADDMEETVVDSVIYI